MKSPRFVLPLGAALIFAPVLLLPLRADGDANLSDVHQILLQAAGPDADNQPPADQQKALLEKALDLLHHVPHVYRGQLKHAQRDLEGALDELSAGDPAHKVRQDIFDADDLIKSIM